MTEPTTKQWASIRLIPWSELLAFVEECAPKIGKYGRTGEAQGTDVLAILNDYERLAGIADELRKIKCKYDAAVDPLYQKIAAAAKERRSAIDALRALQQKEASK